jgi:hypothetical protein
MRHVSIMSALSLAAIMLGGCTYCAGMDATKSWRPQIIQSAKAATPPPIATPPPALPRISLPDPPDCTVEGVAKPVPSSGEPGAYADPNLLEVARLEIERDCYKKAEQHLREEVEKFQQSYEAMK